jgi:hypothetical protein
MKFCEEIESRKNKDVDIALLIKRLRKEKPDIYRHIVALIKNVLDKRT